MFSPTVAKSEVWTSLDPLDRAAIAYLTLPLVIFLMGWFQWWVALPLVACTAYALLPLIAAWPAGGFKLPVTPLQLTVAIAVGCTWTLFGGIGHFFFSNADWHIRDAVLHDLVAAPWPVGYGLLDGMESVLRAPVAFYLPAALVGKWAGLSAAHLAMGAWAAVGATLFLLQVFSLTPSRPGIVFVVVAVVVLFSGLDIIGNLINDGPQFRREWNITTHLEWWAGKYQYSSMTTQLFWVPNHALAGWLTVGLLCRNERRIVLDPLLPIVVVALPLWSPLTAVGVVPFVLLKLSISGFRQRSSIILRPRIWVPALVVGIIVTAFLVLDSSRIPKGLSVGGQPADLVMDLLQQAQFFLLEAGFIGAAILAIRLSSQIALALVILALLPALYLGPGNDLVMRASIPSLAMLTIGACLALTKERADSHDFLKKTMLGGLLALGAVTPVEEIARAAIVPTWPINQRATLIGADCGTYAPNYVARLGSEAIGHLMRRIHRLPLGPQGVESCDNPGHDLMWNWNIVPRNKLHPLVHSNGGI